MPKCIECNIGGIQNPCNPTCDTCSGRNTDYVKVVRCGVCKRSVPQNDMRYCKLHYSHMNDDDYCSYGERKVEE